MVNLELEILVVSLFMVEYCTRGVNGLLRETTS